MKKKNPEIVGLINDTIEKILFDYQFNNNQIPPQLTHLDYPKKEIIVAELTLFFQNIESRFQKTNISEVTTFNKYLAGVINDSIFQCYEIKDIVISVLSQDSSNIYDFLIEIDSFQSDVLNFLIYIVKSLIGENQEFYKFVKSEHPELVDKIGNSIVTIPQDIKFNLLLKNGSRSKLVNLVQNNLKSFGHAVIVDGIFGDKSEKELKSFQKNNELNASGILDNETWDQLIKEINFEPTQKDKDQFSRKQKKTNEDEKNFWWINANPNKWKVADFKIGTHQTYSLYGSKGVKRRIAENFSLVEPGDFGVVYQSAPMLKVAARVEFTKGISDENSKNETIEFKITGHFAAPIDWKVILDDKKLQNIQSIKYNNLGSLFKLSEDEYSRIIFLSNPKPNKLLKTQTQLISDAWAEKDKLGYEYYAKTIYEIIKDEKSNPPLTVAVIAPWGHGKTTLMRYIERYFTNNKSGKENVVENSEIKEKKSWFERIIAFKSKSGESSGATTYKNLKEWIFKPFNSFSEFERPTIWFNPWRYQSSEQIWAGMAHAIITQLAAKLRPLEQERFWFQLRLSRIDSHSIRRDIHSIILEKLIPSILLMVLAILSFSLVLVFKWDITFGYPISGILSAISVFTGINSYKNTLNQKVEGKFSKYISEPNYEGRLGLFHEINKDLENVFKKLVKKDAVIFIDDLDRCSPKIVSEVFEAINMLLNSPFGKNCYFVIGMDAHMVAASLDVEYANLQGKFKVIEERLGSIGWYFLDKFIQLPFFIPVMSPEKQKMYLSELFEETKQDDKGKIETARIQEKTKTSKILTEDEKIKLHEDIKIVLESEDSDKIEKIKKRRVKDESIFIEALIEQGVKEITEDSLEIKKSIVEFADYLNFSPRALKRFANLIRFYTIQQKIRTLKDPESIIGTFSLAKWLIINQGWPQLIRWIQWDKEEYLCRTTIPEIKANLIDTYIKSIKDKNENDFDKNYDLWLKKIKCQDENHLCWLRDKNLFKLLFEKSTEESTLENALKYNVW